MTPTDRKYTKNHCWLLIEDGLAKIGITDHAQKALGEIVFVKFPKVGQEVKACDAFASVESVKTISSIYSPLTGKVALVNDALDDAPEQINSDPYASYIAAFSIIEVDESALLSAEEYDAFAQAGE
ncbi:MAG: glycine cleavage system protein GcvH [Bacillota bacterium]